MTNYPESMPVANLTRRTSASGNEYFSGRWGNAHVSMLKDRDPDNEGRNQRSGKQRTAGEALLAGLASQALHGGR